MKKTRDYIQRRDRDQQTRYPGSNHHAFGETASEVLLLIPCIHGFQEAEIQFIEM